MELQIEPEPSDEERRALLAAAEEMLERSSEPAAARSGWREAGIRENVSDELPDETG
jgi:hypothetical protein